MASNLGGRKGVKILTSTGCDLCKPALFMLQRIKAENDCFDLKVINIRERKYSDLYSQYCHELPVIMVGHSIVAKLKISEKELREGLKKAFQDQGNSEEEVK